MNLISRLFGPQYQDEQLVLHAQNALAVDPLLQDPTTLIVTSAKGVVKLTGPVHRVQDKDRIEGVVREALRHANLKYHGIVNDLIVV